MRSSLLFAFLLLSASASPALGQPDARTQAAEICDIMSKPAQYDGKELVVRGLWRMVIHGSIFYGAACPEVEVNLTETAGYKADKRAMSLVRSLARKDRFVSVEVVFRGTFKVAHEGQCFGEMCASYQLETTELLSAVAPTH